MDVKPIVDKIEAEAKKPENQEKAKNLIVKAWSWFKSKLGMK